MTVTATGSFYWMRRNSDSTLATEEINQTGVLRVIDTPTYAIDIALRIKRE